jgi:exosortase
MTPSRSAARPAGRRSYLPYLPLSLSLACLVWAFWPTLVELFHVWGSDPQYSHGFLVPVFAAFLLWARRDMLKEKATGQASQPDKNSAPPAEEGWRPTWWGLPLVALGVVMHLNEAYYYSVWLDAAALVPCAAGLWLTAGGWKAWRWGWPSIAFLLFMIPLPYRYAVAMSGPLQNLATVSSTFIMQVIGLPALSEGNLISVNDAWVNVAEACSGLRMLVVFVALSVVVVILCGRPLLDKIIILASAVPIAVVSNIIRVTTTGILHYTTSSEVANVFFHDAAGWVMMPLALGMLWLELKLLSYLFIDRPAPPARVARTQPRPNAARPARARWRPKSPPTPSTESVSQQATAPAPEPVAAAKTGTES